VGHRVFGYMCCFLAMSCASPYTVNQHLVCGDDVFAERVHAIVFIFSTAATARDATLRSGVTADVFENNSRFASAKKSRNGE